MAELRSSLGLAVAVLAVTGSAVGGYIARERTDLGSAAPRTLSSQSLLASNDSAAKLTESEYFYAVAQLLERDYVEPVTVDDKMASGSVKSMVGMLLDPESVFMNPAQFKAWQARKQGRFEGIGVELRYQFDPDELRKVQNGDETADSLMLLPEIFVSAVLPGGPAERAGLRVGDRIEKVGDKWVISAADIRPLRALQKKVDHHEAPADELVKMRNVLSEKVKSNIAPNRVREKLMQGTGGNIGLVWTGEGFSKGASIDNRIGKMVGGADATAHDGKEAIEKQVVNVPALVKKPDGTFLLRVLTQTPAELAKQPIPEGATIDLRQSLEGDCDGIVPTLEQLAPAGDYGTIANERKGQIRTVKTTKGPDVKLPYTLIVDESTVGAAAIVAQALAAKGVAVLKGDLPKGPVSWIDHFALPDGSGYTLSIGSFVSAGGGK